MNRAYCDQPHPAGDVEADRHCAIYHRPATPRPIDHLVVEAEGAHGDVNAGDRREWQLRIRDPRMIPSGHQVRMVVICGLRLGDPTDAIARVRRLVEAGAAYQVKAGRA